ncbi:hypothetical protein LBMAG56_17940 [Verrucomicrobiota bacterium]|nr:hypothetical protein LBMAG56_17940 [Verrucomicrobiota bacterium]
MRRPTTHSGMSNITTEAAPLKETLIFMRLQNRTAIRGPQKLAPPRPTGPVRRPARLEIH